MIKLSFGMSTVECPMIVKHIVAIIGKNLKSTNSRTTKDLRLTNTPIHVNQKHAGEPSIV
jgi:hypothetical protein